MDVFPQTDLFGATAVVPHYATVSRVMAVIVAKWLKMPRVRYLGDFRIMATESTIEHALKAFAPLNEIRCFDQKRGIRMRHDDRMCRGKGEFSRCWLGLPGRLSPSAAGVKKPVGEIRLILGQKGIFVAQARKLVGGCNFAQISVTGRLEGGHYAHCTTWKWEEGAGGAERFYTWMSG